MYDLSIPNARPGKCEKCRGSGHYAFGAVINGRPSRGGTCYSCRGTGKQTAADIRRNTTYNVHKVARILAYD